MICETPFTKKQKPFVDHNHKTGVVRGLLCFHCNTGLGHFREKISTLKEAILYLGGKL